MKKSTMVAAALCTLWLGLTAVAWLSPSKTHSDTERRELQQFPELSGESVLSGEFMEGFESFTLDQFPLRDNFRTLKALFHYNLLGQRDNNGIYLSQGHAAQLDYPLNGASLDHALQVIGRIYERYLQDSRVFLSIVPDKGYYLAEPEGYPAMDYGALFEKMQKGMPYASYVNLTDCLTASDYYKTDTHWRQEKLIPAAQRLCDAMGAPGPMQQELRPVAAQRPFYGVYYGQAALPLEPDTLYTMESNLLSQCRVYNYETGSYGSVYDLSKLEGKDMYEVFLSGSVSLLTIENPQATTERELIIFRDSFGSSLAPLLVQGYKSVTLVDVRYISSQMLDRFLDFHGQDVLFLYSTLVLNNAFMLK